MDNFAQNAKKVKEGSETNMALFLVKNGRKYFE